MGLIGDTCIGGVAGKQFIICLDVIMMSLDNTNSWVLKAIDELGYFDQQSVELMWKITFKELSRFTFRRLTIRLVSQKSASSALFQLGLMQRMAAMEHAGREQTSYHIE